MRALFLIPGGSVDQLQALPAVDAVARQLDFRLHVACNLAASGVWKLLPAVEKVMAFDFTAASLADWANLLGSVREPDFQLCVNLARGRQVDLMLSMSHIPTRIAAAGFSATETVTPATGGWPNQALEAYLRPVGVNLDAATFRLSLPRAELDKATTALPAGEGPVLLLAPSASPDDWPAHRWQKLPETIRARLANVRALALPPPASSAQALLERATRVAAADVVLASDPVTLELALLCGVPLVALGRTGESLPARSGIQGLAGGKDLASVSEAEVLAALGMG